MEEGKHETTLSDERLRETAPDRAFLDNHPEKTTESEEKGANGIKVLYFPREGL